MTFMDKTFCASANCKNDCGRKMTERETLLLKSMKNEYVSYGLFCEAENIKDYISIKKNEAPE